MNSYWLWLLLNIIVWPFAILYFNQGLEAMTLRLFGVSLYFVNFFIIPLLLKKKKLLATILSINIIIAILTLFPNDNGGFNPFLLLIITLLIVEGFYRLTFKSSIVLSIIGVFGIGITVQKSNLDIMMQIFIGIFLLFLLIGMVYFKHVKDYMDNLDARYQTLLSEYRRLKRRNISEDEMARQEERVLIAHEIHDSVGHKLTALLMQLEMLRLNISGDYKAQVHSLKDLASDSLEETRKAVKSLKASESGGLPGILRLIRKLESENLIRIHFTVKHGAFTAPLTGEQSFVIYRAVQESLTNIMKHSSVKVAEIMFEAPGGSIFRFVISNPIRDTRHFQEGFGLTAMRERLEKLGGNLTVTKTEEHFVVTGSIKIDYGGFE